MWGAEVLRKQCDNMRHFAPSAAIPRNPGCTLYRFWLHYPGFFRAGKLRSIKWVFRAAFLYIMESDRGRTILPKHFQPCYREPFFCVDWMPYASATNGSYLGDKVLF